MGKGPKQATQNRINTYRQLTNQKMPNHIVNQRSKKWKQL